MLRVDPDVNIDLCKHILAGDVNGFRSDVERLQQRKPLRRKQVERLLSYIDKITDRKLKEDFLTILNEQVSKDGVYGLCTHMHVDPCNPLPVPWQLIGHI